jgi:hypothetical protein
MAVEFIFGIVIFLHERGGGPGFFVFLYLEVLGSSISLIKLGFQTLNFNTEFQNSFCLKFLLLQTQVFAKRVSSCLDLSALATQVLQREFLPVLLPALATHVLQSEFK